MAREQLVGGGFQPPLWAGGFVGQKRAQTAERIARRVGAVCAGERILVWFARVEDPASRRMDRRVAAAAGQGFVQRIVCERVDAEVDRPRTYPLPELYDVLAETMKTICCEANHIAALRRFEWTLLTRLGFAPDLFHDGNGNEINGEETYWLTPEEAVVPLAEADRFHALNKALPYRVRR